MTTNPTTQLETTTMATATVETLTAEVRVLVVGNRQITLSVYRQLDDVPHTAIEPFGRVNTGRTILVSDGWSGYEKTGVAIEVIGRVRSNVAGEGTLVRSYLRKSGTPTFAEWSELPLIVLAGLR